MSFDGATFSAEFMRLRRLLAEKRHKRKLALGEKARSCAQKVAAMLKTKYQVGEVFLYGSLAWGGFTENSDIDLFVAGYRESYWDVLLEAENLARPFKVSTVCEEDASPSLKRFRKG